VIHIDVDGWEIGKNVPGVLGIKADCRAALCALVERLESRAPSDARERVERIASEERRRREQVLADDRRSWDDSPIAVPRLMSELADLLPPEAAIFDEAVTASPALTRYVKPRPGQYFRGRGGSLGPGLPGAVGLKLAMPERPVVGVVADGAAMFTMSALWTAAHHRVPVTWVICNNASYRILKENVMDYLGSSHGTRRFVAMDLTDPPLRFDRLAESMGVHGRRVDRPDDIRPALEEALAMRAPALVDVVLQSAVR
jgi:benzoylformate decarboxylase